MKNSKFNIEISESVKAYILKYTDIESKVITTENKAIKHFMDLGYNKNEIDIETLININKISARGIDFQYYVVETTAKTKHSNYPTNFSEHSSSIPFTRCTYSKEQNEEGFKIEQELKAEEEKKEALKLEAERVKQIEEEVKAKTELEAKAEIEIKLIGWIEAKGSDLLKLRYELGFDYECLVKTEQTASIIGTVDFLKYDDVDVEKTVSRPTIEVLKKIKTYNSIEKVSSFGVYRYNGDVYIGLDIDTILGSHKVLVQA